MFPDYSQPVVSVSPSIHNDETILKHHALKEKVCSPSRWLYQNRDCPPIRTLRLVLIGFPGVWSRNCRRNSPHPPFVVLLSPGVSLGEEGGVSSTHHEHPGHRRSFSAVFGVWARPCGWFGKSQMKPHSGTTKPSERGKRKHFFKCNVIALFRFTGHLRFEVLPNHKHKFYTILI